MKWHNNKLKYVHDVMWRQRKGMRYPKSFCIIMESSTDGYMGKKREKVKWDWMSYGQEVEKKRLYKEEEYDRAQGSWRLDR